MRVATANKVHVDPIEPLQPEVDIRRCEFTNYCEALDQQHKQVTCKLWDRDGLDEPGVALASDRKRRLVAPRAK